jgi:hypothetical protein
MWQQAFDANVPRYSGWTNIGAPSPGIKDACAPAVTSWRENRLDIIVCGGEDHCWYKAYDSVGGGWSPGWEGPLGGPISSGPAITAIHPPALDFFARLPDGGLGHLAPVTMAAWEDLGGQFVGAPAAVSWGEGRLDVFVVNINGEVWWYWSEG